MRAQSRPTSGERSAGASGMPGTEHDIQIRSAASTHIIIGLFVWPLAISYALLGATKADSAWLVLALICAVGFVLHFYFAYLQLTISQGTIVMAGNAALIGKSIRIEPVVLGRKISWRCASNYSEHGLAEYLIKHCNQEFPRELPK